MLYRIILVLALSLSLQAKISVVASTSDLADIAGQIGGKHVTTLSIARGSQDPHYVEVLPSYMIKVKRAESLDEVLWRKLCWNVPFNGLAIACGGITTDRILGNAGHRSRASRLMEEIQAAALTHEIAIEDSFLARQFDLTEPMGAYRPSSLIDFLDGKSVEVETIWGEPLRRGESKGLEMRELRQLYDELKTLTQGK